MNSFGGPLLDETMIASLKSKKSVANNKNVRPLFEVEVKKSQNANLGKLYVRGSLVLLCYRRLEVGTWCSYSVQDTMETIANIQ